MPPRVRRLALALILTLALANLAGAQETLPAPTPFTTVPGQSTVEPIGPPTTVPARPGCSNGPAACAPYEDRNGALLIGNALLDSAPAIPGWLTAVDLGVVVPHISNKLTNPVTLNNGVTDLVHLPTADLDARVMPRVELGYRWGQASGEVVFGYRFLTTDGSQLVSGADLPPFAAAGGAALRSRLDMQVVDLDYGSHEPSAGSLWETKWRIGLRFANSYADSQAANALLYQQTTNRFWGVGPHAALDFRRWLGGSRLALFGRIDTSLPIGRVEQNYNEIAIAPDGTASAGQSRLEQNVTVLSLAFQAGFTWTPCRGDRFHVTAGYTIEHWWDLGSIGVLPVAAREQISIQGGFLRAEWNY